MKIHHNDSFLGEKEEVFGQNHLAPREPKIYSELRSTSKIKRSRIPRPIRESFAQGAIGLGFAVFLVPVAATSGETILAAVAETQPHAENVVLETTAAESPLSRTVEFKIETSSQSGTYLPSSDLVSTARSIEGEEFFEEGEFDRLVTLLEGLPTQPDDTDDFDPDPII
jgi:hypothetical protein